MDRPLEKAIKIIVNRSQPEKIILFGSRASKEHRKDSDYDLLVLKKNIIKKRPLTQDIYRNFNNIGAAIDIILEDIDSYEKLKSNPYLVYYQAEKKGKVVYEKK